MTGGGRPCARQATTIGCVPTAGRRRPRRGRSTGRSRPARARLPAVTRSRSTQQPPADGGLDQAIHGRPASDAAVTSAGPSTFGSRIAATPCRFATARRSSANQGVSRPLMRTWTVCAPPRPATLPYDVGRPLWTVARRHLPDRRSPPPAGPESAFRTRSGDRLAHRARSRPASSRQPRTVRSAAISAAGRPSSRNTSSVSAPCGRTSPPDRTGVPERRNSTFCIATEPSSGSATGTIVPSASYCGSATISVTVADQRRRSLRVGERPMTASLSRWAIRIRPPRRARRRARPVHDRHETTAA